MRIANLSEDALYRTIDSRDSRFDGWFFAAVLTTKIYCRPSCPARTPKQRNVRFYPTAAAAQAAGFRACLRCRPDTVPGSPEWNIRTDTTARAMRLINAGALDRGTVASLAGHLGYSERQLNRLLVAELGAGPRALARAARAHTARTLIETTALPFTEIAFASGFRSIRQFNDTVREIFARTPTQLRTAAGTADRSDATTGGVALRLAYRKPAAIVPLLDFLGARAIAGIETYDSTGYRRALRLPHGAGVIELQARPDHIAATMHLDDLRDLTAAIYASRRLLDLDADPIAIDSVLGTDPALAPLIAKRPGLRLPGSVDPFEIVVRAIVGQQISVAAARTVLSRLTQAHGEELRTPLGAIHRLFPTPAALAAADPSDWSMPRSRKATIQAVAAAMAAGELQLDVGADRADARAALLAIRGIGPWTASYVSLRALSSPDEFLETDLGVLHGAAGIELPTNPRDLLTHAQAWQPFRSYAVMHVWNALS